MDNKKLNDIFQDVGTSFGFWLSTANFYPEYKIHVFESNINSAITWKLPDYYQDMSESAMRDLAFALFDSHISRPLRYTQEIVDYLTSDQFVHNHRNTFLARNGISLNPYDYYEGIPIYRAQLPAGTSKSNGLMRVIIVSDKDTYSEIRPFLPLLAQRVKEYKTDLQSRVYVDKDHADCRHCSSSHRADCVYSRNINNPPYIECCRHWLMENLGNVA